MKGWTAFKTEFNDIFRSLAQLGYAVVFLGHDKKVTDDNGKVISIGPALSNSTKVVISGMADIYAYAHQKAANEMSVLTLRDPSGFIECGCRLQNIPNEITTSYQELTNAVQEAITKDAEATNGEFVTDEKMTFVPVDKEYNFDEMMAEFNELVSALMSKDQSNARLITPIVEKYLGKDRKVAECTPTQCEQLELIILDLKDLKN